jgi:hypothetical protein
MPFELTIAEGKGRGQKFEFTADDVTIGRGAENDVVLYDPGVSRTHARIKVQGVDYLLSDNGSANGTELNGKIIQGAQPLRDGDRIGLGPIVFRFERQAVAPGSQDSTRITSMPAAPKGPRSEETRIGAVPTDGHAKAVAPRAGGALAQPGGTLAERLLALPKPALYGGAGALVLLVGLLAWSAAKQNKKHGLDCPDVAEIDDQVAALTFGHGGVDVDCGNKAQFGFTAPPRTRALFHFVGTHVAKADEVELKLNGKHVAWVPTAASRGEEQVLTLPDELLGKDGKNVVTFAQGTRGKEWSVGKVRVELLAITPGDLNRAREAYNLGRRKLEERRVAPRNLFDAWKYFVEARRQLEGLSPRPALYGEVAQLIKDAERDMEKDCARLLFTAARFEKYGQNDKAQQKYREAVLHFPGDEPSGCRKKARELISSTQQVAQQ